MVRDPSTVSPTLTGVFIGGVIHNKHGTGSRCTLQKEAVSSPLSPTAMAVWPIELQEELGQQDPGGRSSTSLPQWVSLRTPALQPITHRLTWIRTTAGMDASCFHLRDTAPPHLYARAGDDERLMCCGMYGAGQGRAAES